MKKKLLILTIKNKVRSDQNSNGLFKPLSLIYLTKLETIFAQKMKLKCIKYFSLNKPFEFLIIFYLIFTRNLVKFNKMLVIISAINL
jgi:hypothetical protein